MNSKNNDGWMSRRWFLKASTSYITSWVVSTAVGGIIAPSWVMVWSLLFSDKYLTEDEITKILWEGESNHVYLRDRTSSFVNIWVKHHTPLLDGQLQKTVMWESIEEADIVLLEKWGSYFWKLQEYCEKKEKEVKNMDVSHGRISDLIWISATILSTLWILELYSKDIIQLWSKDVEEKKRIRLEYWKRILQILGVSQLGLFPPSSIASFLLTDKSWEYEWKYDISHTVDARTVFMTIEILKTMKENPWKKVVAISWDAHAKWIHYYMYEAEWQREFKNIIYNMIYGIFKLLP